MYAAMKEKTKMEMKQVKAVKIKSPPTVVKIKAPTNKLIKSKSIKYLSTDQETTFSDQPINHGVPRIITNAIAEPAQSTKKPKEKSKIRLFVERVTITGLLESYESHIRADRFMFQLALILSIIGIGFSAALCVRKYMNRGSALGGLEVTGVQAPFPNVTVCAPENAKRNLLKEMIFNYNNSEDFMKKYNLTLDDVIEDVAAMVSYNLRYKPVLKSATTVMKIIDEFTRNRKLGLASLFSLHNPDCSEMFSKCTFGSRVFDCCDATELVIYDGVICFQFSLTRLSEIKSTPEVNGGLADDAIKIEKTGLAFDVNIDWPNVIFWDNLASDGFNVFVGPLPTPWSINPIAIPSDMDATIVLAPPRLVTELEGCRSDKNLPVMPLSPYYDPYGTYCIAEIIPNHMLHLFGCTIPLLSLKLDNQTECDARQANQLGTILNGETFNNLKDPDEIAYVRLDSVKEHESMIFELGHLAFSSCLPFCTRYTYDVLSASYASMQKREHNIEWSDNKQSNRSWSRIRIFFPRASYVVHKEEYLNPIYMAVCEIGGIMGVYLGLSMITIIQILAYGCLICVSTKRRIRVAPA